MIPHPAATSSSYCWSSLIVSWLSLISSARSQTRNNMNSIASPCEKTVHISQYEVNVCLICTYNTFSCIFHSFCHIICICRVWGCVRGRYAKQTHNIKKTKTSILFITFIWSNNIYAMMTLPSQYNLLYYAASWMALHPTCSWVSSVADMMEGSQPPDEIETHWDWMLWFVLCRRRQ